MLGRLAAVAVGISRGTLGMTTKTIGSTTTLSAGYQFATVNLTLFNQGQIGAPTLLNGVYVGLSGGTISNQSGGTILGNVPIQTKTNIAVAVDNASKIAGTSVGINLRGGGLITNETTGLISANVAIEATNAAATVTNAGTIQGGPTGRDDAIDLFGGGAVTNQTGGLISAPRYWGVYFHGGPGSLSNAGSVAGGAQGGGVWLASGGSVSNQTGATLYGGGGSGVKITGTKGSVTNAGTIQSGTASTRNAVYMNVGGGVTNQAGGTITGGQAAGVFISGGPATIVNAGGISGGAASGGVSLVGPGYIVNQTGGTISGNGGFGIKVVGAAATLHNAGAIIGSPSAAAVSLAGGVVGNVVVLYPGASFTGIVDGGNTSAVFYTSELALASSAQTGTLTGLGTQFVNFANVTVAPSASWVLSGPNYVASGVTVTNLGHLTDSGLLTVGGSVAGPVRLSSASSARVVVQAFGSISGTVSAIYAASTDLTVTNAGVITGNTEGVFSLFGGSVTNLSRGLIVGSYAAVLLAGNPGTVVNAGTMIGANTRFTGAVDIGSGGVLRNLAGGLIGGGPGIGVSNETGSASILNAGTITGNLAVSLRVGGYVANQTGGLLDGGAGFGIRITGSAGTVVNAGIIRVGATTGHDAVYLYPGGNVTNQAGGVIDGGNAAGIRIQTTKAQSVSVVNGGSIAGGTLSGGVVLAAPGTVTNLAGATINGRGGIGVKATGAAVTVITAGAILGAATADAIAFAAGVAGNLLQVEPGANFTGLVDGGNTIGSSFISRLELTSGATSGTISLANQAVTNFAAISIDTGATWMLAGADVVPTGASLSNQGTLTISGQLSVGGTMTNAGSVSGGITLGNGASFANQSGASVSANGDALYSTGAAATIVNAGKMTGGFGAGLRLNVGGSVTNQAGGLITSAFDTGLYSGFSGASAGTVVNAGTILGGASEASIAGLKLIGGGTLDNQTGGLIAGAYIAALLGQGIGTVTNAGEILGGATGHALGLSLGSGGSIANLTGGIISGGQYVALRVGGAAGTLVNAGQISGGGAYTAGGAVQFLSGGTITNQAGGIVQGGVGSGVSISGAAGTVVNSGSIAGAAAVRFAAGFVNRLVLNAGATFVGAVDGGNVPGAPIVSTLELASTASNGTLSGLGAQFTNFGQIVEDAGATWSLTGGNTIPAGTTLSAAGTLRASGTLEIDGIVSAPNGVQFAPGQSNRLILAGGLVSAGAIDGGDAAAGSAVSVIELAGTTEGTLTGFGSVFSNFASLQVDRDLIWTIDGSNVLSGAAVTDDGTAIISGNSIAGPSAMTIASASGVTASGTVTAGATMSGATMLTIGAQGEGSLVIDNGGSVGVAAIEIGRSSGGSGTMTVDGAGSALSASGAVVVGDSGLGFLAIRSGATMQAGAALTIGNAIGANGSELTISGAGSRLTVAGPLAAGVGGSAGLQINGGATVTADSLDAGNLAAAVALIGVTGAGSLLQIINDATIADDGTGVLSVLDGATMAAKDLTVGNLGESSGALVVSGGNSVLRLSGALNVGTALGTGDLTIGPGAAVHASVVNLLGQVALEGGLLDPTVSVINQGQTVGGFGTLEAEMIVDEGVIQAGGSKLSQKLLLVRGTVVGGGSLTKNATAQAASPAGVLRINAGGTMELTGPVLNAATTTFADMLTPTGTYAVGDSVVDVSFADAAGVLLLDDIGGFAGTISSFMAGDQFVITGGTLSNLNVSNGDTLTFTDAGPNAGGGHLDQIMFGSGISANQFAIVGGDTVEVVEAVACFAAGTRIETAAGRVDVADLSIGDQVTTADGRLAPIVWIGSRHVECWRHPRPETVWPVVVRAGGLGGNVPLRDLYLSPDHAVFVNGVLVPVRLLIDGAGIAQVRRRHVTYYHVELSWHGIVFAEGLAVESYLDVGDRRNFRAGGDIIARVSDFATPDLASAWEARGAAPLVTAGAELALARQTMAARRTPRGQAVNRRRA
jgi:T5SS/PEP-CTERM-associated repeat protein